MISGRVSVMRGLLLVALVLFPLCRVSAQQPLPRLVRQGDIEIWDEQYLRGGLQGWTVPPDYHEAFGARNGMIPNAIRFGRFGVRSGGLLYTTWRPTVPLSDEARAAGKTTLYDNHRSELVTPPFEIKLDYITFLISGGNLPGEACINLLVDGEVARSATGRDDDLLEWAAFDVKGLRGKQARIQVLDTSIFSYGYVTVDCICQSPDAKGAAHVIATPPEQAGSHGYVETDSGRLEGKSVIEGGELKIGGQPVAFEKLSRWETGIGAAESVAGTQLVLMNGDQLVAEVLGLGEGELRVSHPQFGEMKLPVAAVAQALFQPGAPVEAKAGTLIHANGNEIPGELLWIREGNISINCSLGVLPLPRARVRAYVFSAAKTADNAVDAVVLADGSRLTGKLALEGDGIILNHEALGKQKLVLADVSRISRGTGGAMTPFAALKGELAGSSGRIPPPLPVETENGALRIYPGTVMRYRLPQAEAGLRFRAKIAPLAHGRSPMTATIRAGGKEQGFTIPPDSAGVDVDVDLGKSAEFEIAADVAGPMTYPCGIELNNAFIIGGKAP